MLTVGRRILTNANRFARIAQSVSGTAAVTTSTLQPSFVRHCSYEGDGKTKVKVLNIDFEMGLMINSYGEVSSDASIGTEMCNRFVRVFYR